MQFLSQSTLYITFHEQKFGRNTILFQVLAKVITKTFPQQLFQSALRKEQYSAPSVVHPGHNLPSFKIRQKCNVSVNCYKYWKNLSVRLSQSKCFTRSTKGATGGPFRKAPWAYLTISKESAKTQCLGKSLQVLIKSVRKTFPRLFYKTLCERSNEQLSFFRALCTQLCIS